VVSLFILSITNVNRYQKEKFEDTKGVINIEEGHAIQWPREKEEIDK
jgi:hypothetical protein